MNNREKTAPMIVRSTLKARAAKQVALVTVFAIAFCAIPTALSQTKAIGISQAIAKLPDGIKVPNRYALVIGSSDYDDERVPDLPACHNDALGIHAVLIDPASGMFPKENVTLLVKDQITKPNIIDALDALGRRAGPEDLVVVFYSGHGAIDSRQRAYWVMADTNVDKLRATALSETDVTELLSEIRTKRLITLIDACYSAATANISQTKSLLDLRKIYPKFKGEGRVAITASKGDQLSIVIKDESHPGFGYSAFAWHLIDGMRGKGDENRDGVITVDELWGYVKDRTERTSREQGGEQQPQLKGQLGSKFMLSIYANRLLKSVEALEKERSVSLGHVSKLKKLAMAGKLPATVFQKSERVLTKSISELDSYEERQRAEILSVIRGDLAPEKLERALELIARPSVVTKSTTPLTVTPNTKPTAPKKDLRKSYGTRSLRAAQLLEQAFAMREANRLQDCLELLDKCLEIDPRLQLALYTKASVIKETGEIEECIKLYDKAIALDRFSTIAQECCMDVGIVYGRLGDARNSNVYLTRAILIDPNNDLGWLWRPYRNMAITHYEHGLPFSATLLAQIARKYSTQQVKEGMITQFQQKMNDSNSQHARLLDVGVKHNVPETRSANTELLPLNQIPLSITNGIQSILPLPTGSSTVLIEVKKDYYQLIEHHDKPVMRRIDVKGTILAGTTSGDDLWLLMDRPSELLKVEAPTGTILQRLNAGGAKTSSIAVFPTLGRMFFAASGNVMDIDLSTGRRIATSLAGTFVRAHPDGQHLFVAYVTPVDMKKRAAYNAAMDEHVQQVNAFNRRSSYNPGMPNMGMRSAPRGIPPSPPRMDTDWQKTHLYRYLVVPGTPGALLLAELKKNVASNGHNLLMSADGKWVSVIAGGGFRPTLGGVRGGYGATVYSTFDFSEPVGFYATPKPTYPRLGAINPVTGQFVIGDDTALGVYDLDSSKALTDNRKIPGKMRGVAWSGDGRHLIVAAKEGVTLYSNKLSKKETARARAWQENAMTPTVLIAGVEKHRTSIAQGIEPIEVLQGFTLEADGDDLRNAIAIAVRDSKRMIPPDWMSSDIYVDLESHRPLSALSEEANKDSVKGVTIFKLKKLWQRESKLYPAACLLGKIYLKQGRRKEGRDLLTKAIRGDSGRTSTSLEALQALAQDCLNAHEDTAALYCLAWAFHLDQESQSIKGNLIAVLQRTGMLKEVMMVKEMQ